MYLFKKSAISVLKEAGVTHLYHANSVLTSLSFLRSSSLLSRGTMERRNFPQTSQRSDPTDKRFGIWFDLFFDSDDNHFRASRANPYGPVLFVFKIDALSRMQTGPLWVSKLNPMYWEEGIITNRWHKDKSELKTNFQKGNFGQHIVIRHSGGELPFESEHLQRIIVDKPSHPGVQARAMRALRTAAEEGGLSDVEIVGRECRVGCGCARHWTSTNIPKMFSASPQ